MIWKKLKDFWDDLPEFVTFFLFPVLGLGLWIVFVYWSWQGLLALLLAGVLLAFVLWLDGVIYRD